MSYVDETLARVKKQNPDQPEFNQAVYEVLESLRPVIEKNEDAYRRDALLERLTTPERAVLFRVPWVDDKGQVQVNNGYRVKLEIGSSSTAPSDPTRAVCASIPALP